MLALPRDVPPSLHRRGAEMNGEVAECQLNVFMTPLRPLRCPPRLRGEEPVVCRLLAVEVAEGAEAIAGGLVERAHDLAAGGEGQPDVKTWTVGGGWREDVLRALL